MAKTASKTRKKPAPKEEAPQRPLQPRVPIYGERVRRTGSDMEYEITYISPDNTYVNIGIPRTNFEHRHVEVSALIFLEESRTPSKPAKPTYDLEAIEECLATAQHASAEEVSKNSMPSAMTANNAGGPQSRRSRSCSNHDFFHVSQPHAGTLWLESKLSGYIARQTADD